MRVRIDSPTEVMEAWLRENRGEMRTKSIVAFKDLIEKSKSWTVK